MCLQARCSTRWCSTRFSLLLTATIEHSASSMQYRTRESAAGNLLARSQGHANQRVFVGDDAGRCRPERSFHHRPLYPDVCPIAGPPVRDGVDGENG